MSDYEIVLQDSSGNEITLVPSGGFHYSDKLNALNEGTILLESTTPAQRTAINANTDVLIRRKGTLVFKGFIDDTTSLRGGGIKLYIAGYEKHLAEEKGTFSNSPWTSTSPNTIFADILGESNYFTVGSTASSGTIDFRAVPGSDSLLNAVQSLIRKIGQDYVVDYTNDELDLVTARGSTTSAFTLNEGIEFDDLVFRTGRPRGNDVRVWGKGDGENQIKSDNTTSGQDASSKSTYGTITYVHRDPKVISEDEANTLADTLVAKLKQPIKVYEFTMLRLNMNIGTGDVITLNAPSYGLEGEEVRVVAQERGIRGGQEYLVLQVTNSEFAEVEKTTALRLAELENKMREQLTSMQGNSNTLTYADQINCNDTYPLIINCPIPSTFITDEAGNLRVTTWNMDYDIDPFRREVATASESNTAPDVAGASSNTAPDVAGTSASTAPFSSEGSDSSTATMSSGWNTSVLLEPVSNAEVEYMIADVLIEANASATIDMMIELECGGGGITRDWVKDLVTSTHAKVIQKSYVIPVHASLSAAAVTLDVWVNGAGAINYDFSMDVYAFNQTHTHLDGSYAAANHSHADGSFAAASHNHGVVVGDAVSDAGSLNATATDVYVDYWNGSSWVQKASGSLGVGPGTVNLTAGGTLPDAAGLWRVRLNTDASSPDLAKGIIKVKHSIDN